MWPWGHLAVGYVIYSAFERLRGAGAPSQRNAFVLAVATQVPDLVDKPLAWQFGVMESGVGIAHSLLVGVPIAVLLGAWLYRRGHPGPGGAIAVGHVTHVLGDLLFGWLFGKPPLLPAFLWPLRSTVEPASASAGFADRVWDLLLNSQELFATPTGRQYFLLQGVLLLVTVGLWFNDGMPGLKPWRRAEKP